MFRLIFLAGIIAFTADAFNDKNRANFGNYQWAEVGIIVLLIIAVTIITIFASESDD